MEPEAAGGGRAVRAVRARHKVCIARANAESLERLAHELDLRAGAQSLVDEAAALVLLLRIAGLQAQNEFAASHGSR
jgi:hypothetical protein